jgi:succinate dehydrogenase / fumarate reductase, cytochrome b subunit
MSTAAINPKGSRVLVSTRTPAVWVSTYLGSSVGQKILVAVTGVSLVTFLVFHMLGNLKVFSGAESLNKYAHFLKHDLGALIWIARAGLLGLFLTHVLLALRLKLKTNAARPIGYQRFQSAQASVSAKTMIWTGLVVLAFVLFHLAHFTFAWVNGVENKDGTFTNFLSLTDTNGHHDVYRMVIAGFSVHWISLTYFLCQLLLFVHLGHGIQSSLQTLGLVGKRFTPAARLLGWSVAGTIFLGNTAIVVAIWLGLVK